MMRSNPNQVEQPAVVVYDILGKQVAKLFEGVANPGIYRIVELIVLRLLVEYASTRLQQKATPS
jgi:hypothetical protein